MTCSSGTGAFSIELIAERTRKYGLQGKVAISHAFALGTVEAVAVCPGERTVLKRGQFLTEK